jgi:hypothetical protein
LADRERRRGADHPDTLGTRNNLAAAYQHVGRTADAERRVACRDGHRPLARQGPGRSSHCRQESVSKRLLAFGVRMENLGQWSVGWEFVEEEVDAIDPRLVGGLHCSWPANASKVSTYSTPAFTAFSLIALLSASVMSFIQLTSAGSMKPTVPQIGTGQSHTTALSSHVGSSLWLR